MSGVVLLCTVGGAHQPILKAIDSTTPRHVCFFCTDRDPETGKPGSIVQVTGKGAVIKAYITRLRKGWTASELLPAPRTTVHALRSRGR